MGAGRGDDAAARERLRLARGGVDPWWERLPHPGGPATKGLVLILDTCAERGMPRISLVDEGGHFRLSATTPDANASGGKCASWLISREQAGWLTELCPASLLEPLGTPTSEGHNGLFVAQLHPRGQTYDAEALKRRGRGRGLSASRRRAE
jgi:hypothetical protein